VTTIRLRTRLGDDPKMSMRYEWFRDLHGMSHDCAVAHALVMALDSAAGGEVGSVWAGEFRDRARRILASDFGIPATQRSEGEEG